MEFFRRLFGKSDASPPTAVGLPQLCYDIAYFILPPYLFNEPEKTIARFTNPEFPQFPAGAWFYVFACKRRGIEPDEANLDRFPVHSGEIVPGINYHVLQYPEPPPVDMGRRDAVLAPFFSGILHIASSGVIDYFILGQRPFATDGHARRDERQSR
jgi:hypothetical protein